MTEKEQGCVKAERKGKRSVEVEGSGTKCGTEGGMEQGSEEVKGEGEKRIVEMKGEGNREVWKWRGWELESVEVEEKGTKCGSGGGMELGSEEAERERNRKMWKWREKEPGSGWEREQGSVCVLSLIHI